MRRSTPIVWLLLAAAGGCGPDAPRDNPYDVSQTGVYGTTYRRSGGTLGGVSITASPASVTASSDAQGGYSMDLAPGSRQVLLFAKQGYQAVTDTVDVPERGLTQRNVILPGQATVDTAVVRTVVRRRLDGSLRYHIEPSLVVSHQDGSAYLDSFGYQCRIDTVSRVLVETGSRGDYTLLYGCTIDTIPGVSGFGGWIVGRVAQFLITSPSYSLLINRLVPPFLEPPPSGLSFAPPDTLRWTNGQYNVRIRVEVWNSGALCWTKDTTNIETVRIGTALASGTYVWYVIQLNAAGDRSLAEATFIKP